MNKNVLTRLKLILELAHQIVSDWKTKADSLSQELDTSQRECRLVGVVKMIMIMITIIIMIKIMIMIMMRLR